MAYQLKCPITEASMELFIGFAKDAGNWNNMPMLDITKEQRGNLTQLKKAGLVTTSESDDLDWVHFTKSGAALAKEFGHEVEATAKES